MNFPELTVSSRSRRDWPMDFLGGGAVLRRCVRTLFFFLLLSTGSAAADSFELRHVTIPIQQVDLGAALKQGPLYPQVDWERIDFEKPTIVTSNHFAYVLKNSRVEVVLLPAQGRIYCIVERISGHDQLWTNPVARPIRAHNDAGWWMVWGGIEFAVPRGEHGTTWSLPWRYSIEEDSARQKAVRMQVTEPATGLEQQIRVSIDRDSSLVTANLRVRNTTKTNVLFSHWTNPMLSPGGRNELTPRTELVVPCSAMIVPDRDFTKWMGPSRQDFSTNLLRFIENWRAPGDLLAESLTDDFFGAFSHEADEGIVRIADRRITPGMDIWSWGFPPPPNRQREYSLAPNLGYVEMWGGTATNYTDEARAVLLPFETREWNERFISFTKTGGLTFANTNVVVGFRWQRAKSKITVGLFPVRPARFAFEIRHGSRVMRQREMTLRSPRKFTFDSDGEIEEAPFLDLRIERKEPIKIQAQVE